MSRENSTSLDILIPARNEIFLAKTIDNILENIEGDTRIIAVCDGYWPKPSVKDHPKVTLIHLTESIGQRAATNMACKTSDAKYVMKVDAHCAFDKGFDVVMMKDMQEDWTMVPVMRNLHAFDWVCKNGHRRYQGPSGVCKECGEPTTMDIKWIGKNSPQSTSYCFDTEPHFQYFGRYKALQKGDLVETMSLQGSCFMMTRKKYWELNICDESFGSWGSQGIEVAVKTWLSGGKVMCNKKTWYAHMFRTQGGDFGFPYKLSGNQVTKAKRLAKEVFFNNKFDKQIYPLSWLVKKFWPVTGWEEKDLYSLNNARILYYTDNRLNMKIARMCRKQLESAGLSITSVSLKPMGFGDNIHFKGERGYLTMYKQILTGLLSIKEDVVFFAEHDVLYHPSHFLFRPKNKETFYYASNYWFLRPDGFAISYDVSPLSGLVAYREPLIAHFKERVELIEKEGFSYKMGFEPFTHRRIKWKTWYSFETFKSPYPNIDISHEGNVTWKRWSQDKFRRKPTNWQESTDYQIPGWGRVVV